MGQVIGKEDKGYFVTITIGAGTGDLTTIKDIFSFNLDVLRFMLTRRDIRPEKPRNKRTRTGFKKSDSHSVKENVEEAKEVLEIKETPEIKEVVGEEEIIEGNTEEAVIEGPTAAEEEKEIDLNELDKKLDELLN